MLLALALSWDSFFAGLLDGYFDLSQASRRYFPILFGLCDGMAVGIGFLDAGDPLVRLGQFSGIWWLLSWLLLAFLVLQRLINRRSREIKWLIYVVPVLLSLDNLIAAPAFTQMGISPIFCVSSAAAVSALLFAVGAICGRGARSRLPLFLHSAD